MQIAPLNSVEIAVLHDRFAPMEDAELRTAISIAVRAAGLPDTLKPIIGDGPPNAYVQVADYYVLVSQNAKPLALRGFERALAAPITALRSKDMPARVARYVANSFVSVGKGIPVTPELAPLLDPIRTRMSTWAEAETAIKVAYWVGHALMAHNAASAVEWCMANALLEQQQYELVGASQSLLPICIAPSLFSSAGHFGPGVPLGMALWGSQYLIGRPVLCDEAAVPLEWWLARATTFIQMCQLRGSVIPDGGTFGNDVTEKIRVTHTPASKDAPLGNCRLTVLEAPDYDISAGKTKPKSFMARFLTRH